MRRMVPLTQKACYTEAGQIALGGVPYLKMADDREWVSIGQWLVDARLLESRAVGRCRIEIGRASCRERV